MLDFDVGLFVPLQLGRALDIKARSARTSEKTQDIRHHAIVLPILALSLGIADSYAGILLKCLEATVSRFTGVSL